MLAIKLDALGTHSIRWPVKDALIISLSKRYLEKEASLPEEQQVKAPSLAQINQLTTDAEGAVSAAQSGESSRAKFSREVKEAMKRAMPLLRQAIGALKVQYAENLAVLKDWGLVTKGGGTTEVVYAPAKATDWAMFLMAYVAKESSLPEAERIVKPALPDLEKEASIVGPGLSARNSGRSQRKQGTARRESVCQPLLGMLQVAACVLLTRSDLKVTPSLEDWGFTIVASNAAAEQNDGSSQPDASASGSSAGGAAEADAGPA